MKAFRVPKLLFSFVAISLEPAVPYSTELNNTALNPRQAVQYRSSRTATMSAPEMASVCHLVPEAQATIKTFKRKTPTKPDKPTALICNL